MKLKKTIILSCIILLTAYIAKASARKDTTTLSKCSAVSIFIKAVSGEGSENLQDALDDSFQYSMLQLNKQIYLEKNYFLDFFKRNAIIRQDCTIQTTVVMQNKNLGVVKVDMHYKTFTRSYYLTLTNTGSRRKIIYVYNVITN